MNSTVSLVQEKLITKNDFPSFSSGDTITVYYQKDDRAFSFVLPRAYESIKSTPDAKLIIKGEIGSQYKISNDPVTGGYVENIVTLKAVYKPKSLILSPITLVDNQQAVIAVGDDVTRSSVVSRHDRKPTRAGFQ